MPIISNLTDRPVLLAFNSGQTLRLSPRATSEEIHEVEILNNAKVAKLSALNIIAVEEAPARKRASAGASAGSGDPHAEKAGAKSPGAESAPRTTASDKSADKSDRPAKRPE